MPLFGRSPITPDPSGAFALNRWILNVDGHAVPLDMSDEPNVETWIDVARSQANPDLARIEWSGRTNAIGIGRVVGRRTLERAREAYRGVPGALSQLDSEEMEWCDDNIQPPRTHYMNAEILDIAPRPIGGLTPAERDGIGSFVQLITPTQGAWMGGTELSTVEHRITGSESIEAMRGDADTLVTKLESIMDGQFRKLRGSLDALRNEIERLSTGDVLGVDEQSAEALDDCDNMIDVLRTLTTVLCRNNPSMECLEIVALIRRLDRRLQMMRDDISGGIWTELQI